MKIKAAILTAAILAAAPAWAINKCTGPDGKTVFQDAPCPGKGEQITVKPASGNAQKPQPSPQVTPVLPRPQQPPPPRKKKAPGDSWQRRTFLENRGVPDAEAAVNAHRLNCEQKQASLRAVKAQPTTTWLAPPTFNPCRRNASHSNHVRRSLTRTQCQSGLYEEGTARAASPAVAKQTAAATLLM